LRDQKQAFEVFPIGFIRRREGRTYIELLAP